MTPRRRKPHGEDFQMAPMIDMVFLLLVFFMTVSTMAREARPELDLPLSTTGKVPDEAPPRNIISVRKQEDGLQYFWGSQVVDPGDLGGLMEERSRDSPGQVLLRGQPDLTWSTWKSLLNLCREEGISDLVLATFED